MEEPTSEQEIHEIAEIAKKEITPVNKVESALSDFVKDTFSMVNEDYDFNRKIRDKLLDEMADNKLTSAQLVMLYTTDSVNISDRMSKTLSPLMQLLTAKQQAEMARVQKETAGIANTSDVGLLNKTVPNDIIIGLKTLVDMARSLPVKTEPSE